MFNVLVVTLSLNAPSFFFFFSDVWSVFETPNDAVSECVGDKWHCPEAYLICYDTPDTFAIDIQESLRMSRDEGELFLTGFLNSRINLFRQSFFKNVRKIQNFAYIHEATSAHKGIALTSLPNLNRTDCTALFRIIMSLIIPIGVISREPVVVPLASGETFHRILPILPVILPS